MPSRIQDVLHVSGAVGMSDEQLSKRFSLGDNRITRMAKNSCAASCFFGIPVMFDSRSDLLLEMLPDYKYQPEGFQPQPLLIGARY
jgi:hypothetical protein